jgi:hypothetical protein
MDIRSEQNDSIFSVIMFATRQSFLYRQSSQSKKTTAGFARSPFVVAIVVVVVDVARRSRRRAVVKAPLGDDASRRRSVRVKDAAARVP